MRCIMYVSVIPANVRTSAMPNFKCFGGEATVKPKAF